MHTGPSSMNWDGLIVAVLVFTGVAMAGVAGADSQQDNVGPNLTIDSLPGTFNNTTGSSASFPDIRYPPVLDIVRVEAENTTYTVFGHASPGSPNETIFTLLWNWGDNSTPEYHLFPNTHEYPVPGRYTLTITAGQSDGQYASKTMAIDISVQAAPKITGTTGTIPVPIFPAGPAFIAGAPSLMLLEPVIDGMNVTLNGNLDAGGPGLAISSVNVDWDDGYATRSTDLPASHRYNSSGIYTINVTGIQSDGQLTSKRITVDLKSDSPSQPFPAMSNPPPNSPPIFLTILVTAIAVVALALVAQRLFYRRHGVPEGPDIPRSVSAQEELFHRARSSGDTTTAAASAHVCAQLFRTYAESTPGRRAFYLEMAEKWESIARETAASSPLGEQNGRKASPLPVQVPPVELLQKACAGTDIRPDVLLAVINVALEIAREGREGQAVGTSFVVGDTDNVMNHSRQFVLNPFHGHREEKRDVTDPGIQGSIKEFAQLDGAFIVSGNGIVEAAGRYLTADMSRVKIPEGYGSRHSSIAGITLVTGSIGVVVSQSGGLITLFKDGEIIFRIQS